MRIYEQCSNTGCGGECFQLDTIGITWEGTLNKELSGLVLRIVCLQQNLLIGLEAGRHTLIVVGTMSWAG